MRQRLDEQHQGTKGLHLVRLEAPTVDRVIFCLYSSLHRINKPAGSANVHP